MQDLYSIIDRLKPQLCGDDVWHSYLKKFHTSQSVPHSVHLAIFVEPYLKFIFEGKKTIESRFSANRCAPYNKVNRGDLILLKKSSGPMVGICQAGTIWSYQLNENSWKQIMNFAKAICPDNPDFWASRQKAAFATLIEIQHVRTTKPMEIEKRDRRGWVVMQEALQLPFMPGG